MSKPNLYVFGIGGTGSRVLKSLMFLLASGVKINTERIIPIIIDPDLSNGDLNRTYDILKNYSNIKKDIESGKGRTSTKIIVGISSIFIISAFVSATLYELWLVIGLVLIIMAIYAIRGSKTKA